METLSRTTITGLLSVRRQMSMLFNVLGKKTGKKENNRLGAVAVAASVNRNRLEAIIQSVTITLKE